MSHGFSAELTDITDIVFLQSQLPIELMEILIIRTIVAFYTTLRSRDADMVAVTTVMSVCCLWWRVIARRKWNQRQIRRILRCNDFFDIYVML